MLPGHIDGATRSMGKDQEEFTTLRIRDEVIECAGVGLVRSMRSAWFPTPDEIKRMQDGAPIYLQIIGTQHPPVWLRVGQVPPEQPDPLEDVE